MEKAIKFLLKYHSDIPDLMMSLLGHMGSDTDIHQLALSTAPGKSWDLATPGGCKTERGSCHGSLRQKQRKFSAKKEV